MEKIYDKRFACLLCVFLLPLLFLPKLNIIGFGRETAGIRIDDIFLFGFSFVCLWGNFVVRKEFSAIERAVFGITLLSIFSYIINRLFFYGSILEVHGSPFYCLRLFEYFMFFYVGALAVRFISINTLVFWFFLWNFFLMILQKAQIIGIFSVEGYIPKTSDRILGIASFGSEIGLLLNLLFCFLIYNETNNKWKIQCFPKEMQNFFRATKNYWLLLIFTALVVLSGARMAIAALLISFLFSLHHFVKWNKPSTLVLPAIFLSLASCVLVVVLYSSSNIIMRSKGLFSFSNIELIGTVWDNIVLDYDPIGRESVSQGAHDASWWMRIHKWCYALKLYYLHPESWLQGIGPGFAMAALDGGFLRILTEVGIIGSYFYYKLFSSIAKQSVQLKWMIIVFLLNMLFFDAYLAYKPMSLLFLISGAHYAKSYSKSKKEIVFENKIVMV